MNKVLKLAKYLTLHLGAMNGKYDLNKIFYCISELTGLFDSMKLLSIAEELDTAISEYTGVKNNVSKG